VTWNTKPAWTATAAATAASDSTANAWVTFNVLALTQAQYTGGNNGYYVKDQTEAGTASANAFYSNGAAKAPPTTPHSTWPGPD
jgi:hypothetical protein